MILLVLTQNIDSRDQTKYMLNVEGPILKLISRLCYEEFEKRIDDDVGQPRI